MGFLNALFLAGTATLAVPIVIHLIFKSRKQRLVFSSLRFLRESVLKESRRLRLRDWILLLLRCLACLLIALAFARPYRIGQVLAGPGGEAREDLVIVLDNSPSMGAQDGAVSRFRSAVERAVKLCEAPNLERLGLVLSSEAQRSEVELSRNFKAVRDALKKLSRPAFTRGDPAQALNTALDLLADSAAPRRRVVFISDFQANQTDRDAFAEAARRAETPAHRVKVQLEGPAPDGAAPGKLNNVAIAALRAKSDVWIAHRPIRFAVRLVNHSDGEAPHLGVRLVSGKKVLARKTVGLGPRTATEVELGAVFPKPGEVSGHVEIAAHDVFPADDKRFFALRLRGSVRVLVVEDRLRKSETFFDQSYFLRMALDPRPRSTEGAMGGEGGADTAGAGYVRAIPKAVGDLLPNDYKNADVVFLVGLSEMPSMALAALEQAVRGGRNLVLFLGRSEGTLSEGFYNGPFWKKGEGLLPARPGVRYEGNLLEGKYDGLDAFKAGHPVFKPFVGANEADLRRPKFLKHYRIDPNDLKAGKRPPGEVLASFNDGSPYLVERAFGKGKVLMFTFCPRPENTDLPKRKAFVPLIHQLVRYLAGAEAGNRRNVLVGQALALSEAGAGAETAVRLKRPPPLNDTLESLGAENITTSVVGIYEASFRSGKRPVTARWAANLDPGESELNSEDLEALRAPFASNLKEAKEHGASDVQLKAQADAEQKGQAPDWRYLLVAALACLLLEVWVRDFWGD